MEKNRRTLGAACLMGYVGTVLLANWLLHTIGIVPILGLAIPAGTFAAGLAFTMRDLTQETLGRWATVVGVLVGATLSAAVSTQLAVASGVAFLISELADFAVYTPLRARGFLPAVVASNTVGLVADSVLFLLLAFGSLEFLAGQLVGKAVMTALAVAALGLMRSRMERRWISSG